MSKVRLSVYVGIGILLVGSVIYYCYNAIGPTGNSDGSSGSDTSGSSGSIFSGAVNAWRALVGAAQ